MKANIPLTALLMAVLVTCTSGCSGKGHPQPSLRDLGNGICHEVSSGLMWQSEASTTLATADEAHAYAAALTLGGHTDWRLPSRQELYDLVYLIDLHANGNCTLSAEGKYWSWEEGGQGQAGAWEITANQCDPARQYRVGRQGRVRAVRP